MPPPADQSFERERRLFLEEICCDLCRFEHTREGVPPEAIRIRTEVQLGGGDAFADIQVQPGGEPPYFVEVKYGYNPGALIEQLQRKYATAPGGAARVAVVVQRLSAEATAALEAGLRAALDPALTIELWDEENLFARIEECFGVKLRDLETEEEILELRHAFDEAKGRYAFEEEWNGSEIQRSLLWHFSFWRIRQLRHARQLTPRQIVPPGMYRGVVAILADLCAFSSYMRDTRDEEVVRHCVTAFYSKARYEILSSGGMMYQFVGDEVIGLFGVPDHPEGCYEAVIQAAEALLSIGASISNEWQRHLDRAQNARGVHVGIAMGDLQIVSLRPFGRAHLSAVSDTINMGARLLAAAGPGEIIVSNSLFQRLGRGTQMQFSAMEPVEARNMGRINAWKRNPGPG
jgi:class 3 adenylate cyclase